MRFEWVFLVRPPLVEMLLIVIHMHWKYKWIITFKMIIFNYLTTFYNIRFFQVLYIIYIYIIYTIYIYIYIYIYIEEWAVYMEEYSWRLMLFSIHDKPEHSFMYTEREFSKTNTFDLSFLLFSHSFVIDLEKEFYL